jgi:hypothetical protein
MGIKEEQTKELKVEQTMGMKGLSSFYDFRISYILSE